MDGFTLSGPGHDSLVDLHVYNWAVVLNISEEMDIHDVAQWNSRAEH